MTQQITWRNETGIDGQPIVVAECGSAPALYDVRTGEYDVQSALERMKALGWNVSRTHESWWH